MYQDKRKEQADKMNYFDCHVDTLTEILKPGDTHWMKIPAIWI